MRLKKLFRKYWVLASLVLAFAAFIFVAINAIIVVVAPPAQVVFNPVTASQPPPSATPTYSPRVEDIKNIVPNGENGVEEKEPELIVVKTSIEVIPDKPSYEDRLKKFMVKAKVYYNEINYSSNHYDYTDEELYMLAQVIDAEARNQPFKGKVGVGNVVMNRVLASGYPGETITSVITRKNQFCYIPSRKPTKDSIRAATAVLKDEYWTVPQNTYFFRATKKKGNWGGHKYFTKIGGHTFYTDDYSGRYKGKTPPPKLFSRTYKWPQYGCKLEYRVKDLQRMLIKLGYNDVKADSYFGKGTKDAVVDFQKKHGLEADGVAGEGTLIAMFKEVDKLK